MKSAKVKVFETALRNAFGFFYMWVDIFLLVSYV